MDIASNQITAPTLKAQWESLLQTNPHLRIRDAAAQLEVSEAQLLATTIGEHCIRLEGNWQNWLKRLPELGHVMSLTRNESCILEHKGTFEKVNTFGRGTHHMGTVIGAIETRVFFAAWHVAFAVVQQKQDRTLKSLQVFDKSGEAITKIFLEAGANEAAYEQLVADFRAADQSPEQAVSEMEDFAYETHIDRSAFLHDWANMQDTHDFFPMLRKHKAHRFHALELAEGQFCQQVDPACTQNLLEKAAKTKLPIMIFAGNKGNLQIHQGKVRTIRMLDRGQQLWLNVLDPEFNMHLRQDHVDSAWVVNKPTSDGLVTSLELFDKQKNLIAQFFGLRKPGQAQNEAWTELINHVPAIGV